MAPHSPPIETLSDLRAALDAGRLRVRNPAAAAATLDLAQAVAGADFARAPLAAAQSRFEARFPEDPHPADTTVFGGAPAYRRWRRAMVRLLRLSGAGDTSDPMDVLDAFADREGWRRPERAVFERELPGTRVAEIDRRLAVETDRPLRHNRRAAFRREIVKLDRLRQIPDVVRLGLLDPEPIGPFPRYRDGDRERLALPPGLASVTETLQAEYAGRVRRVYEIAHDAGLLDDDRDIALDDLVSAATWDALQDAVKTALPTSGTVYLRTLLQTVRARAPDSVPDGLRVGRTWSESVSPAVSATGGARNAARGAPDDDAGPVSLKRGRDRLPGFVCGALAGYEAGGVSMRERKTLRTVLRILLADTGATDLDTLLQGAEARLDARLPDHAAGTKRQYRSVLRRFLAFTGQEAPWAALRRRATAPGLPETSTRGLAALALAAETHDPPLAPRDIDRQTALSLVARARERGPGSSVQRLRAGLRDLDHLRPHLPDLLTDTPIGPLEDGRKQGNTDLPDALRSALDAHAAAYGFTPAGSKALRVAVTKLCSVSADHAAFAAPLADIPFRDLLAAARRVDERAMVPYADEIERLAARLEMHWTHGWQRLLGAVVRAGVPRSDNPVEALARVAVPAGLEPWQIDREWAWSHERTLRPDLRLTWSANIDRFDALGAHPDISQTDLLPPARLGPMPPRGGRTRHGVYPLPPAVEQALDGAPKSLLESAHFIWRGARELDLWSRGDAPDAEALFADPILRRVAAGPHGLGRQALDVHLDRIRGWRAERVAAGLATGQAPPLP